MPGTRIYFMALALTLARNNALLFENKQRRNVKSMGFNLIFDHQKLNFDLETDVSNRSVNFLFVSLHPMVDFIEHFFDVVHADIPMLFGLDLCWSVVYNFNLLNRYSNKNIVRNPC